MVCFELFAYKIVQVPIFFILLARTRTKQVSKFIFANKNKELHEGTKVKNTIRFDYKIPYQFTIIVNADKDLNRKKLKEKLYGGDNTKQANA